MNHVTDRELVLFHYGEDLGPGRKAEVEEALSLDAELRLRLADLRESLAVVDAAWPAAEPEGGLEARLWQRLAPRLPERRPAAWWRRWREWIEPLRPAPFAFASLLIVALGVGYVAGRRQGADAPPAAAAPLLADDASSRVLAAYLVAHLQDTERALLVASRTPEDGAAAQRLASGLLESHRLYALAAERAGKPQLAAFLRELEPVLIELSNEQGSVSPALGEAIVSRDLAFKSRAAAALARNEFAATPQSL